MAARSIAAPSSSYGEENWSAILRGIKVLVPFRFFPTNRLRTSLTSFLVNTNQHDGCSMAATLVYRSVKYLGKTKNPNCSCHCLVSQISLRHKNITTCVCVCSFFSWEPVMWSWRDAPSPSSSQHQDPKPYLSTVNGWELDPTYK